jgi:AAA domain
VANLAEILATFRDTGYLIAPAGFGKTHLIAEAVSLGSKRQLVLTHTHAGVNVLRHKMGELKVSPKLFRVDTIASFALRLCLSYSETSEWTSERPVGPQWTDLYKACSLLFDSAFIRRIIRASYFGLYVDEYQDCSTMQHDLVLKLARDLPCRLLGDPLQGIFDFDQQPIDWERNISGAFACLGQMQIPHRWNRAGTPAIGAWLTAVRDGLENRQSVDLTRDIPRGVARKAVPEGQLSRVQANACRFFPCDADETAIAIHKGSREYKSKCHVLAKNVGGRFSSIEEIEGKAVFSFIGKYEKAKTNRQRLKEIIALAADCMTAVNLSLPAATLRGETANIQDTTRNPMVAKAANAFLANPSSNTMGEFLWTLKSIDRVKVTRADLFGRVTGILRKHALHQQLTLAQSAEKYHAEFRYNGRPSGRRKLIGTTLLVKGLEFDHAIVLDADSLSRKELYVAITRGAKSLTIISSSSVLNPAD